MSCSFLKFKGLCKKESQEGVIGIFNKNQNKKDTIFPIPGIYGHFTIY